MLSLDHQNQPIQYPQNLGLLKGLTAKALSCGHVLPNGWSTAAYKAWSNDDWFCDGGFREGEGE